MPSKLFVGFYEIHFSFQKNLFLIQIHTWCLSFLSVAMIKSPDKKSNLGRKGITLAYNCSVTESVTAVKAGQQSGKAWPQRQEAD